MLASISKTFAAPNSVVCDTIEGLPFDFEADRYMGTWFEYAHSANQRFAPDSNVCTQANYRDLDAVNGTFKVDNSYQVSFTDPTVHLVGDAKCPAD